MSNVRLYRKDENEAARIFRPVIQALSFRTPDTNIVELGKVESLDFIENIGDITITFRSIDLKNVAGLFFYKKLPETREILIYVDNQFYKENNLKDAKLAGIHEFCHFMALFYKLTSSTIKNQAEEFSNELSGLSDKLYKNHLTNLYAALDLNLEADMDAIKHEHFKIDTEDVDLDYSELQKTLLFSKSLFETKFDSIKQDNFKKMYNSDDKVQKDMAYKEYFDIVHSIANEKSIPMRLATRQALKWMNDYS